MHLNKCYKRIALRKRKKISHLSSNLSKRKKLNFNLKVMNLREEVVRSNWKWKMRRTSIGRTGEFIGKKGLSSRSQRKLKRDRWSLRMRNGWRTFSFWNRNFWAFKRWMTGSTTSKTFTRTLSMTWRNYFERRRNLMETLLASKLWKRWKNGCEESYSTT